MPVVASDKLDRKELRKLMAQLSEEDLSHFSLSNNAKRAPRTEFEIKLQSLWGEVLGLPLSSIGIDDSFCNLVVTRFWQSRL